MARRGQKKVGETGNRLGVLRTVLARGCAKMRSASFFLPRWGQRRCGERRAT